MIKCLDKSKWLIWRNGINNYILSEYAIPQ